MQLKLYTMFLALMTAIVAFSVEPLKIRGTAYANWWHIGETVCFKGNQPIPAEDRIQVKVTDVTGKEVCTESVSGADFNERGWCWKPLYPGYFEAEFIQSGSQTGSVTESYHFKVARQNAQTKKYSLAGEADVPVTKHPFAVATPTRKVPEISPIFSMSPHFGRYRDFLPLSRLVGFRNIRVHYINWAQTEKEKGVWDWKALDEFMQLAHEHGYTDAEITLNLMATPRWASSRPEADWVNICIREYMTVIPKDMEDWKNFIRMVMRRYPGVKKYELWNEPHLIGYSCFWSDSVENFVALLKAGYETVKEENPEAMVLLGGIGMRYLPFYEELLKQGGDNWYDVLPMHGSWPQMAPFWRMDKKYGRKSKPWQTSEWHAMLLRANYQWPSEQMLARNMLCDFLNQVRQGAQEVDFFCIVNAVNFEKECLPLMKKFFSGSSSHVSGLFRKTPFLAPRYQAVAWHVLSDKVKGNLSVLDGFRFGNGKQCAIRLRSDAGELLVFWNEDEKAVVIDPELAGIISSSFVCEADGRPVEKTATMKLAPEFYYIAENPDSKRLEMAKKFIAEVLIPQGKAVALSHEVHGNYLSGELFDADLRLTPAGRNATRMQLGEKVICEPEIKAKDISGAFSVAINPKNFELYVEVDDAVHHPEIGSKPWNGDSIQFAFDAYNRGIDSDRIEFCMAIAPDGSAHLVKNFAAKVGGDLPQQYTTVNEPVRTATASGRRQGNKTVYCLRLPLSELYPLIIPSNSTLRFSLLVNNNDGNGRAHYREWSSGIGSSKNPVEYGDLTVMQPQQDLLKGIVFRPFKSKVDQRLTQKANGYRIEAGSIHTAEASGISTKVNGLMPNASYRLVFRAKGNAKLQVVVHANKQRIDLLGRTALKDSWRDFELIITMPENAQTCSLSFFAWEQSGVEFELEGISLLPY